MVFLAGRIRQTSISSIPLFEKACLSALHRVILSPHAHFYGLTAPISFSRISDCCPASFGDEVVLQELLR